MAWKPPDHDSTLNTIVQAVDIDTLVLILQRLPPKACHDFERRIAAVRGKEALDLVAAAEKARKPAGSQR